MRDKSGKSINKENDIRGQGNQNVKGTTNTQAIRETDQNAARKNQPQQPGSKHHGERVEKMR